MGAVLALLSNVWVQRAGLVLALLIAGLGLRQHYINVGHTEGHQEAQQQTADQLAQQAKENREATQKVLDAAQAVIDNAQAQQKQAQAQLHALAQQRAAIPQQVAGMTPNQVQQQIDAALGRQNAVAGQYTSADNQRILQTIDNLKLCDAQLTAETAKQAATQSELDGTQAQNKALLSYAIGLEQNYTELWNTTAQPKRGAKCLWIWKCTRPKIKAPDPTLLLAPQAVKAARGK